MLLALSQLRKFTVEALDGPAGSISDFYIDDATWRVTHAVYTTGTRLIGRKVLVRTSELGLPDLRHGSFRLSLTLEQIKAAPPLVPPPRRTMADFAAWLVEGPGADTGGAPDYHISDFLAEGCWRIRYVCVEVGDMLSPRKRAVPVQRLAPAHVEQRKLETPLIRGVIQNGPDIGASKHVSRGLQQKLEKYYAQFG